MLSSKFCLSIFAALIAFTILAMPVYAETIVAGETTVYKQYNPATLEFPVFENNYTKCVSCTCEVSILYPNGTYMVKDGSATMDSNHGTYLLNVMQTSILGLYTVKVFCTNGVDSGIGSFSYLVTSTGMENNSFIVLILAASSIVFFLIYIYTRENILGFVTGSLFMITGIFLIIYGIGSSNDMYTRSVGYVGIGISIILILASSYNMIVGNEEGED